MAAVERVLVLSFFAALEQRLIALDAAAQDPAAGLGIAKGSERIEAVEATVQLSGTLSFPCEGIGFC